MTDRLIRHLHTRDSEPLVAVEPVKGALRLAAVNDAAARLGLSPGLALADTRAMYPQIAIADADPDADRRTLAAIADWCDRYTPLVGLDPPDGLLLDITGCAHLFGGEAALRRDIVARLERQGFQARAAIADTVGCAWAMARYGKESCIATDQTRDVLLPLPLAALRITQETVAELAQVGLKRIADVIERPRAPLAARFGTDFVRRLDQAVGRDDESITPRLPVPSYVTERRFAEPIALEADVLNTIGHLAHELTRLMERRGEGARLIDVALFRTDGKVHRIAAGTGAPLRDAARIRALFVERLAAIGDESDPGFGYDVVRLGARATERCDPVQTGLAAPDHAAELAHLIDRLGARFGLRRVTRLMPQDTHIPEFAVAAVAAATFRNVAAHASVELRSMAPHRPLPLKGGGTGWGSQIQARTQTPSPPLPLSGRGSRPSLLQQQRPFLSAEQDSLAPIRPIRLFERPEPIEAIAEVPDGPPVQFTWRHVRYAVAHAEGPERIAMEWWRDEQGQALTRDYFRVESRDGVRVWLYRQSLFNDHVFNDRAPPNWFLHGVFA
jgi:protein ImuB